MSSLEVGLDLTHKLKYSHTVHSCQYAFESYVPLYARIANLSRISRATEKIVNYLSRIMYPEFNE